MNKDEKERLRRMVKERERCREVLSNARGIRGISAFPRDGSRPKMGETISFEIRSGPDGKTRAVAVQRPEAATANGRPKPGVTSSKSRKGALAPILLFIGLVCFAGYRFSNSSP